MQRFYSRKHVKKTLESYLRTNLKKVLPESDLAVFYDNTIEFRRFAIYKNGNPVRVSHNVPKWYEKFVADMK